MRLDEMLCAYLGGSVRRVKMVTTHNIPEVYADVLVHDLTSYNPTSSLVLMLRALTKYVTGLWMRGQTIDGKRARWKINHSRGNHLHQACRAMERGDFKAFQHHRKQ